MPVPVMSIKDSVSSFYYHNYYTHHRSLSLSFSSSSSLLLLLLLLLLLFLVLVVLLFKTGIITFDSNAALHNTFNNLTYQTEKALKTLVGNKFKKIASKWGTRIDKAEKIARDKLFTARGVTDLKPQMWCWYLRTENRLDTKNLISHRSGHLRLA